MATIHPIIPTENQEQRALVKWVRMQNLYGDLLIKLNNEGKRPAGQGWHLKLMGLVPGASDLFLAYPTKGFSGLWLEVKQNRRYLPSEMAKPTWLAQQRFINRMVSVGYQAHFCYGWEHGKRLIESYLFPDTIG